MLDKRDGIASTGLLLRPVAIIPASLSKATSDCCVG